MVDVGNNGGVAVWATEEGWWKAKDSAATALTSDPVAASISCHAYVTRSKNRISRKWTRKRIEANDGCSEWKGTVKGWNSFGNCFICTIESSKVLFVAKFRQELTELGFSWQGYFRMERKWEMVGITSANDPMTSLIGLPCFLRLKWGENWLI